LQSDTDEQLLITINFKDTVNIEAVSFGAPVDGKHIPPGWQRRRKTTCCGCFVSLVHHASVSPLYYMLPSPPPYPLVESAPLTVKLFANGVNLSFENCEDLKPTQEFQLAPADLAPDSMTKLYAVKFQRVSSLTVRTRFVYRLVGWWLVGWLG
jgi:hypothetical protein